MSRPLLSSPAWQVETRGLDAVPLQERRGGLRGVFAVWFAGNLAITSVVIGAVVASYGLSLVQSLVALLGVASFVLVGCFAVPGMRTGTPTMALSQRTFGTWGNLAPSLLSWLNLVGWETVVLVIASYALAAVYQAAFHARPGAPVLVGCLAVVACLAFSIAFLGHAAIVRLQVVFACLFGALTVAVCVLLLPRIHWQALAGAHGGSWLTGVLPAFSIVVAASGLSWVNMASDYSRYLPADTPATRLVWATAAGGTIPVFALMVLGVLLASGVPSLASSANPIGDLEGALPDWIRVVYLLTAVGGMVTGDVLDIYSAGLSLLAAGLRLARSRTVFVDAAVSIGASLYVLLVARNVVGTFEAFLGVLAGVLAPWSAVFLLDLRRAGAKASARPQKTVSFRWQACAAWLIGVVVSLCFTSTGVFTGPLALGVFRGSSLGFLLGFAVTLALYGALQARSTRAGRTGRPATAQDDSRGP
jgi:purine-cytosine permease-like protein